jgi:MFS family permease
MLATIASALTLVWLGKVADRFEPAVLAALTLAALAGSALLLGGADSVFLLAIALFGLRLFGQGMTSHLAMTFTARWFRRERGRALGLTFLGYPVGEAVLPILVALLLGLVAWRWIWVGIAIAVVLLVMPMVLFLGHRLRSARSINTPTQTVAAEWPQDRSWRRAQVLRDPRFYGLLPGILAAPFVITGIFFTSCTRSRSRAGA